MLNNAITSDPEQIVEACANHIQNLLAIKPRNPNIEAKWLDLPIWNS